MNQSCLFLIACVILAIPTNALRGEERGFALSSATTQAVLGIAEGWDSSAVTLQRFERRPGGSWGPAGAPCRGRLGAQGLVWGRGLHPTPSSVQLKKEGDKRAPAGVFGIGGACGYEGSIPRHPSLSYFQVTPSDLWIEDPASPNYNRHIRLTGLPRDQWEQKQQMKQRDPAHALKLFILHNAPPHAVPGAGSSIFFHIWRGGGTKATSGCTTMPEPVLREMIRWLNPQRFPVYILLPRNEYRQRREAWGLP
ncbi:MAG: L,D-transpeptidase family protein [Verrucomicrobiales bacterium]